MRRVLFAGIACAGVLASSGSAALNLLTWNAGEGTVEALAPRLGEIGKLGKEVRAKTKGGRLPEIVVLQEVTSYAAAVSVARALGYKTGTVAVSNSGDDGEVWPLALEVAVIARRKVLSVTSYQNTVKEDSAPFVVNLANGVLSSGVAKKIDIPAEVGAAREAFVPRSVLRVELAGGTVVYGVHLNSSGLGFCRLENFARGASEMKKKAEALGLADEAAQVEKARKAILAKMPAARSPGVEATRQDALGRARSREAVAGALAKLAAIDIKAGKTVFAAGDFNTPLFEACKTGKKLGEDFEPLVGCDTGQTPATCGATDGFDDTYAILTDGLIDGVRFKVLTGGIGRTYAKQKFVDSPIDNVLTAGPGSAAKFGAVKLGSPGPKERVYGSDHYPVLVRQD
jgi:hypothetical protein